MGEYLSTIRGRGVQIVKYFAFHCLCPLSCHRKPSNQLGRSWPKYVPEERRYMRLDPYSSDIAVGPHENQCNLWRFMFQTASPAVVRNTRP